MNLTQLECLIDLDFADELSFRIEEDVISVAWYEKEAKRWYMQVVCDPSQESFVKHKISLFFKERGIHFPQVISGPLPQEDWVSAVYRDFPPLTIGQFYIYGSHIQEKPPITHLPLRIDAATAFGSGQHESTEGCLKALTLLAEKQAFQNPLDMGCGSGILALAMARLWNEPVMACDNDPEAVRVTIENARINHLDLLIKAYVSEGFSQLKNKTFDIITANILAGPLCQMAEDAARALRPHGYIVLAGLLTRQTDSVVQTYESAGITFKNQIFIGDWSTLIMGKENHG